MNSNTYNHHHTSSTSPQEIVEGSSLPTPLVLGGGIGGGGGEEGFGDKKHKKKRSKLTRLGNEHLGGSSKSNIGYQRPKSTAKKPEPNAPKITHPCSECGKKFWSWKALFGHMRCHPERQWRGINPPPNFRKPGPLVDQGVGAEALLNWTDEEHEGATSLLMLANGSIPMDTQSVRFNSGGSQETEDYIGEVEQQGIGFADAIGSSSSSYRFECSSCKKVFGSHQALGGHRASHKNVKGCFAIARTDDDQNIEIDQNYYIDNIDSNCEKEGRMATDFGHKCGICSRVFSTGQALGGHMRCHWEKGEDPSLFSTTTARDGDGLDLNLPPPPPPPPLVETTSHRDGNSYSSTTSHSSSSVVGLDLRLGI